MVGLGFFGGRPADAPSAGVGDPEHVKQICSIKGNADGTRGDCRVGLSSWAGAARFKPPCDLGAGGRAPGRGRGLAGWGGDRAGLPAHDGHDGYARRSHAREISVQELMLTDMKNAALAFAVQGACLGLALGLAGGLARGSARSGAAAGLAGAVLGGALALGASAALQPVYYRNVQLDQIEQGLTVPMLVHGGIWGTAGVVGGLAFGLGLGRGRAAIVRAAVGGLAGVLLAAFVFEATAAMAFPNAATTRLPSR